jgi:hypothetical protein
MRHRRYPLTRRDVHRHATDRLLTHLRLPHASRRCPPAALLSVVLLAAARLTSLSTASAETVRRAPRASPPVGRSWSGG